MFKELSFHFSEAAMARYTKFLFQFYSQYILNSMQADVNLNETAPPI